MDDVRGYWNEDIPTGVVTYRLRTPEMGVDEWGNPCWWANTVLPEHIKFIKNATAGMTPPQVMDFISSFYADDEQVASRSGE